MDYRINLLNINKELEKIDLLLDFIQDLKDTNSYNELELFIREINSYLLDEKFYYGEE